MTGGLGSFRLGIFENMCLVEGHFLEESHSLCKFLLSLPGKPTITSVVSAGWSKFSLKSTHFFVIFLSRIAAVHSFSVASQPL